MPWRVTLRPRLAHTSAVSWHHCWDQLAVSWWGQERGKEGRQRDFSHVAPPTPISQRSELGPCPRHGTGMAETTTWLCDQRLWRVRTGPQVILSGSVWHRRSWRGWGARSPGAQPGWPGQTRGLQIHAVPRAGPGGQGQAAPTPAACFPLAPVPLSCCEQEEPTYFAIWGDNKAFNEVIISPAMLHEHLPYVVMEGLNKVSRGPRWPGPSSHYSQGGHDTQKRPLPGHPVGRGAPSCPGLHTPALSTPLCGPGVEESRRCMGTCP